MELHVMVAGVLGMIGCAYMLAFWGSAIFKGCYSYLQDGDKSVGDFCEWLESNVGEKCGYTGMGDYLWFGILIPILYIIATAIIIGVTAHTGSLLPIILVSILAAFLLLYIMRAVIRLNKKLDKHSSDKDAHK